MSRFLIAVLMLVSLDATAAVRRLATDCTLPASAPTESAPFDLDACTLQNGDDITQLLTDIRDKWPSGFYVRAPSKSLTLESNTIYWPSETKFYIFLEDQDPQNKLLIQHASNPPDFWTMWKFENFNSVKIGGPNLSLTLQGNHPGLANCDQQQAPGTAAGYTTTQVKICDFAEGLVEFRMSDGSLAQLADFRANIKFAQHYGLYTWGRNDYDGNLTTNKIQQLNVAGEFYATSGIFFHQGVRNAWADPNRTVIKDPYVRLWGWDGTAPGPKQAGLPLGCNDQVRDQVRANSFSGFYTESIRGGITIENGPFSWIPRYSGRIGSAEEPFIVRIKDWSVSGPGTPYPAGVRVKGTGEATLMKGDPNDAFGSDSPVRFIRFVKLPDEYGSGPGYLSLPGCSYDNNWPDAASNVIRFENSIGSTRFTRNFQVQFEGDWRRPSEGGTFDRGELVRFSFDPYRSYMNIIRAAKGTVITDTLTLNDTDTVTGQGTFTDLAVADYNANNPGRNSTIKDTNVAGVVSVSAGTENTRIANVNFTGEARAIITVGAGSTVAVSDLCAPSGSTITGTGSVTYNGASVTLPFAISSANACDAGTASVPSPPGSVVVN